MKSILTSVSVVAVTAAGASAGGLDRTGQPINVIFEKGGEKGGYAELSFASSYPDVTGEGAGISVDTPLGPYQVLAPGTKYGNVGDSFFNFGAAVKMQFSEKASAALIFEQPFGSDIIYPGKGATSEFGGTSAIADTTSLTALLRYKFTERWSAHGGVRIQRAGGDIDLSGMAYGPFSGYSVNLEQDTALGYVVGGAFEIPAIAGRISLTYNSAISHDMETEESGPPITVQHPVFGAVELDLLNGDSTTEVKTPQSVNLEFQTGVAVDTLVFGSIRWVEWSEFKIDPKNFYAAAGEGLVDLDDTTTLQLGLGRLFTEKWAGSASVSYEMPTDEMVSPLAPTDGLWALALGAAYDMGDVKISGGAQYSWLGDAEPQTGDVVRAKFDDNTALSVGLRIGYDF